MPATAYSLASFRVKPPKPGPLVSAGYGSLFGLTDQGAQLKLKGVKSDALGMQHVRFDQMQNGLPVFGADLIVHLNKMARCPPSTGISCPMRSPFLPSQH